MTFSTAPHVHEPLLSATPDCSTLRLRLGAYTVAWNAAYGFTGTPAQRQRAEQVMQYVLDRAPIVARVECGA